MDRVWRQIAQLARDKPGTASDAPLAPATPGSGPSSSNVLLPDVDMGNENETEGTHIERYVYDPNIHGASTDSLRSGDPSEMDEYPMQSHNTLEGESQKDKSLRVFLHQLQDQKADKVKVEYCE